MGIQSLTLSQVLAVRGGAEPRASGAGVLYVYLDERLYGFTLKLSAFFTHIYRLSLHTCHMYPELEVEHIVSSRSEITVSEVPPVSYFLDPRLLHQ